MKDDIRVTLGKFDLVRRFGDTLAAMLQPVTEGGGESPARVGCRAPGVPVPPVGGDGR